MRRIALKGRIALKALCCYDAGQCNLTAAGAETNFSYKGGEISTV
jgi:hypothetical protein